MPRVRVSFHSVELRIAAPALAQVTITCTVNVHWRAGATVIRQSAPRLVRLRASSVDVEVADGETLFLRVVVQDSTGAEHEVAWSTRVSAAVESHHQESGELTVTATLVPLTAATPTPRSVQRSGGGARSAVNVGGRPPPVRVEVVHPIDGQFECPASGNNAGVMRMGLWEEAWDPANGSLRNGTTDAEHFIGRDPRRFYVRVVDPAAAGTPSVAVKVRTLHPGGRVLDDGAGNPTITCTPVRGRPDVFVSRALMLVSSAVDLGVPHLHSGDIPGGGARSPGEADFRLRLASMFGHVEAEYAGASHPARVELFRAERKQLHLQLYEVDGSLHRSGNGNDLWNDDLRVARETYARMGVWIWTSPATTVAAPDLHRHRYPGGTTTDHLARVPIPPRRGDESGDRNADDIRLALAWAHPGPSIRCFYTNLVRDRGGSYPETFVSAGSDGFQQLVNTVFINSTSRTTYTLAHEIMHILLDSSGPTEASQHYSGPDMAHNLLRMGGTATRQAWDATSRIRLLQTEIVMRRIGGLL